jgi:hypothetical protein
VELALLRPDLGDVNVEVADRVAFELRAPRLVALSVRQTADAMALEAAVQAGAGEVRKRGLEGVEAVVQRQQRVAAEGHKDGLVLDRQDRRSGLLGPVRRSEMEVRFLHLATVLGLIP